MLTNREMGVPKMGDYMIVGIILVVLLIAIFSIQKKAKSKASCCGSAAYVAKARKLQNVKEKKIFRVEGMHCQNCVNRVVETVQDIPGTSVTVHLKKGLVTVALDRDVEDEVIIAAIEKRGYTVQGKRS